MRAAEPQRRCFGLTLASEVPLPELDVAPAGSAADVTVRRAALPGRATDAVDLPLGLWHAGDVIGFSVEGTASYEVRGGSEVLVDVEPGADPAAVRLYLLGTCLGALMMQRGHLVLHGNAFRVGDACAVVVGHSGAGKSTLAAELQRRGIEVLSDDVVPVDAEGRALPGYPRIKLWGDAVSDLGLSTADLDRVATALDKFQLPITQRSPGPLPIRWVYVLERHEGASLELASAAGMETFALLREHTYRHELLHGEEAVRTHLELCSRLAGQARVTRVTRPVRTMTAAATADAILGDITASARAEESA